MVNNNGVRELAYVVRIQEIKPIEGYDRVEYARVEAGWWIVVRKEQFRGRSLGAPSKKENI